MGSLVVVPHNSRFSSPNVFTRSIFDHFFKKTEEPNGPREARKRARFFLPLKGSKGMKMRATAHVPGVRPAKSSFGRVLGFNETFNVKLSLKNSKKFCF